jgi:hypothetical protein
VNYAEYERIPVRPVSSTLRILAKSNPITGKKAFYGNYGGPGNSGGKPHDEMDELFRRHDIVYHTARTKEAMLAADASLVERLHTLDVERLGSEAAEYRERAVGFLTSPVSHVIGKPLCSFFCRREQAGCYFQNCDVVQEFFAEGHPGIPEAEQRMVAVRGE